MDPWWWVPIGLAAWFLVGFTIAFCLGPVLRRASQVREAPDQQLGEKPDEPHDSPGDEEGQGSPQTMKTSSLADSRNLASSSSYRTPVQLAFSVFRSWRSPAAAGLDRCAPGRGRLLAGPLFLPSGVSRAIEDDPAERG